MRFQLQFFPNKNIVQIHVDTRLIHGVCLPLCGPLCKKMHKEIVQEAIDAQALVNFYELVNRLDGVEPTMSFARHCITAYKAPLFDWPDILPHILEALSIYFAHGGVVIEAGPPSYPTKEQVEASKSWSTL